MVSKASEDLPEPDRPVITTRLSRGQVDVDVAQIVFAGAANTDDLLHRPGFETSC